MCCGILKHFKNWNMILDGSIYLIEEVSGHMRPNPDPFLSNW